MADIDVVEKPRTNLAWVWALVAVLAVGGLMAWLAMQSERLATETVVQEEGTTQPAPAGAAAGDTEPAELGEVAGAPESFVGRRVRIDQVSVAATLGPSAFWGDIPGANPFLVVLGPDVTGQPQLEAGGSFSVVGVVNEVNDQVLDEWTASGALRPGARDEAGFATHYLQVQQISQ